MTETQSLLDLVGPYHGPCAFCGASDARHRVVDAIVDRITAGDSVEAVAADYGVSEVVAGILAEHWPVPSVDKKAKLTG